MHFFMYLFIHFVSLHVPRNVVKYFFCVFVFPCIITLYYIKNQRDAALAVLTIKEGTCYVYHNYLLLYTVKSIMLHVSTLHLGHLQALTKN